MTTVADTSDTDSDAESVGPRFSCHYSTERDISVVDLVGELDIETSSMARTVLLTALHRSTGSVFLDLSQVSFLDSAGVSALVSAHRRAEALDREIALVSPSPTVSKILTITGLDRLFPVRDSLPSVGR